MAFSDESDGFEEGERRRLEGARRERECERERGWREGRRREIE